MWIKSVHNGLLKIKQTKAMAAFLSGEMKDTVQMNPAGAYGLSLSTYLFFPKTT
jgi:phospholipid:diacylglycerol acyltransferase